jgi:hypothetical protein
MTRKVNGVEPRVETGPVQFGADWPGTFFRGDDSGGLAGALKGIAKSIELGEAHPEFAKYLRELAETFSQCQIKGGWDERQA